METSIQISIEEFERVEIRTGTVVKVEAFPEARKPAWKLWIDLGPELGTKQSSAQLTAHYDASTLVGRQVLCVTNFADRQIGPFVSQVLVMGLVCSDGVVLAVPERPVPDGTRLA